MNDQKFDINSLRIAKPCPTTWESMSGDDRTRFCNLCELNVYNVAEMNSAEVTQLMTQREGQVCMRLYRRADGTVLTKDCPVGVRAFRKRASAIASAAVAAVLGLFSVSYAQKDKDATVINGNEAQVVRSVDASGKSSFFGTVVDVNGAVIPNAKLTLYRNGKEQAAGASSDADGKFSFDSLAPGFYELRIPAANGFRRLIVRKLEILHGEKHEAVLTLDAFFHTVLVGGVGDPGLIDFTSNDRKTVFTREMLDRMPAGRPFD